MTSHTSKTNNRHATSSRYQMSFYSITTHVSPALHRVCFLSFSSHLPLVANLMQYERKKKLLSMRQMFERQRSLGTKERYTSNVGDDGNNRGAHAHSQKHSVFSSFCSFSFGIMTRMVYQALSAPLTYKSTS